MQTILRRIASTNRRFALFTLVAALIGLTVHETARNAASNAQISPPAASPVAPMVGTPLAAAPAAAGMVAAIDPETGLLTEPSREQMRELLGGADAWQRTTGVEIVQHPDGTVIGRLDESFLLYSVAHIDADGRLHSDCAEGAPARDAALAAATARIAAPAPSPRTTAAPEK